MATRVGLVVLGLYVVAGGGCSRESGGLPGGFTPDPMLLPMTAAPLELCRSGRMLVGARRAGFCVPATSGPRACFACQDGEACVCGRCAFSTCGASADCPAGSRCRRGRCDPSCSGDADCTAGRRCIDRVCLARCAPGCAPGERCLAGSCEAAPCSTVSDCQTGERCDLVREEANLVEPSVVRLPGVLLMALEERRSTGSVIVVARSMEGRRWEVDPGSALVATADWESGSVGAPALVSSEDGVVLYYEGGDGAGIGVARAAEDVRSFTPEAEPLLVPALEWEAGRVGAPAPLEGGVALYYETGQAAVAAAGACRSDADCGGATTRCRAGTCRPVAAAIALARFGGDRVERRLVLTSSNVSARGALRSNGDPLWGEVSAVFSPSAASCPTCAEPLTLLFFSGVGVELPGAAPNRSLALAAARDDGDFAPYPFNPVVARLLLFTQPLGESGAWALSAPGGLWIYFDSSEPSGAPAVPGVASSPQARIVSGEGS